MIQLGGKCKYLAINSVGTAKSYSGGPTEHAAGIKVTGDSSHDGTIN